VNTVYLHGGIGKRFGRKWQFDARNSQEVIKALDANNEGFIAYVVKQALEGNEHFLLAKHPDKIKSEEDLIDNIITENEINREIHVVPSVYGGFVATWLAGFSMISTTAAGAMSAALWGGLAQLAIGALQKAPENKVNTRGENVSTKSFLLGASQETASQGGSIPLGYGRALVGPSLIGQSMATTRLDSTYLESSNQLTFTHLICEGPIEGPVNEYGNKINAWNYSSGQLVQNPDVQQALYVNDIQVLKGDLYNFNLNENNELPSININQKESKILDDHVAIIHTINQELFGVSPHYGIGGAHLPISEAFPTSQSKEKPIIVSHKISNINTREVIINFRASVFVTRQQDGRNLADTVYFAIFILEDDGIRRNVLHHPDRYVLRLDGNNLRDANLKNLGVHTDPSGRIFLSGVATSAYQFEFYIGFRQQCRKNAPTIQVVKLSKETDVSAASNIYTTWTTTRKKSWGRKAVDRHEKTDWNSIGGQGRSRSISVASIEERIVGKFAYPNCVTSRIVIDSLNFATQPTFMWHLKLKKVLIPQNYNPKTRQYSGPWNGLFKGQTQGQSIYSIDEKHKEWTDNPAWIFYDMVSNPTYGCGKYGVNEYDIDKWQIYKIAKYCDEMVETNYEIQTDSGFLKTFEYESFGNVLYTEGGADRNNSVAQFKITLDRSIYYKDQNGNLATQTDDDVSFDSYYEFTKAGTATLTIPEGVTQIEVLTIGGGGSGQAMKNTDFRTAQVVSAINGSNGGASSVSSSNWSVTSGGGYGGGIYGSPINTISGEREVVAKLNGLAPDRSGKGAGRPGTKNLLIPPSVGSDAAPPATGGFTSRPYRSSNTPSFGAGSGAAPKVSHWWLTRWGIFRVVYASVQYLFGGGSAASALVRFDVVPGQTININVGAGGVPTYSIDEGEMWRGRQHYSQSGAGGSGMVSVRYVNTKKYSDLSSKQKFIKSFGDGESFKGKSVAFLINKHNYGSDALNYKQQIKNKSVLNQNCVIERRQIVNSNPDEFTVTLAGEDFSKHEASFEVDVDGKRKYIMYGACAAEVDHPIVEPRFTANIYLKDSIESVNLLNMFANMFRARLSYSSGKISVQQDSKNLPIQLFNNTNVSKEGFAYSGSQKDQRFSVAKVMFNNKENEFKEEYVYEEDTTAIQKIGIIETDTSAVSVSSESEARRLAKWILMSSQYEQEVVKFTTGNEGAYSFPGAIIEIYDEMRSGDLRSGRILDIIDDVAGSNDTYFLIDKSIIKEPILGDIEFTVSCGADNATLNQIESRAQNEPSVTDQDYEIENLKSQQLLKFQARLIPDTNESKSRVVDIVAKMQFEISIDESIFKIFYHGFKNGDKIRFYSDGVLPSGLSPFEQYYVINANKHSFKVSLYQPIPLSGVLTLPAQTEDSNLVANIVNGTETSFTTELNVGDYIMIEGFDFIVTAIRNDTTLTINKSHPKGFIQATAYKNIVPINLFDIGKDKLFNIGGEHFVIPVDPQKNQEKINQVMIGSIYAIRGNIGVIEDNKDIMTSDNLIKIGVSETLKDDWLMSSIFGQVKIVDANWIYARNLGWIYIRDIIDRQSQDVNEYFWFYVGSFGWVGTTELLKNTTWYIPSLKQNKYGATGFIDIRYHPDSGNICSVFVYYENQENIDLSLDSFNLGSSNRKLGRLCKINQVRNEVMPYGYMLKISDYNEDIEQYSPSITDLPGLADTNTLKMFTTDNVINESVGTIQIKLYESAHSSDAEFAEEFGHEGSFEGKKIVFFLHQTDEDIGVDEIAYRSSLAQGEIRVEERVILGSDAPSRQVAVFGPAFDSGITAGACTTQVIESEGVLNEDKYDKIKITGGYQVNQGESLQQRHAVRLNIENQLQFDLSRNYNMFISGISGDESESINKTWNFIFINETTVELADSANASFSVSSLNFENAYLYLVKEFDNDLKKFVEAKYFKVLNNKEVSNGKYEITATEYSYDKFDAIDKKGVIRKPVIPIPPQEGMDIPKAPANLVLTSSTE